MLHHHAAGVAGQALGRFCRNAHAVFEDGLPWLIGICQHWGIDVDDDLVPFARGARIDPMVESSLRESSQGIGLLLLECRPKPTRP